MSGLLCAGDVRLAILNDDGSFVGFLGIKNTTQLAIQAGEGSEITRTSKQRANYGQVLDTVVIPGQPQVTLQFDEGDAETIGMALLGTVETLTVASQTRTDVDLAVTKLDVWLDLGDRYISPTGFEVTNTLGDVTYVLGTDYVVDYAMGLIKFLSDGDVVVDEVVKRSYTTVAKAGKRIQGSKKSSLRAHIYMLGKNLADGYANVVDIPDCRLRSNSELDVLSDGFAVTSLTGSIIGDYTVDMLDAEA